MLNEKEAHGNVWTRNKPRRERIWYCQVLFPTTVRLESKEGEVIKNRQVCGEVTSQ